MLTSVGMYTGKPYLCTMTHELTPLRVACMLRPRPADAHKGILGHALLVAGSRGVGGCAVLAAESCLRSGVGKLTVCTPESNRLLVQMAVPEAVLRTLPDASGTAVVAFPVGDFPWQAIGMGPGIGLDADHLVNALLDSPHGMPLVLDADALRILARHAEWMTRLHGRAVLTPHGGEMRALAMCLLGQDVACSDADALRACAVRFASEYGVWVVLKGHPTLVCSPDGCIDACPRGNAGMATAGAGDVLTGIITGLLAQGYGPAEAALLGVWQHATAGDLAAAQLGQETMLARDITAHLHKAWAELHECLNNSRK